MMASSTNRKNIYLKTITLLKEEVQNWDSHPFSVPAIKSLDTLELNSPLCFLVGENGTGKSTLLEAIASHCGYGSEGGTKNIYHRTGQDAYYQPAELLSKTIRLSWSKKLFQGYFFRAESFFNIASHLDTLEKESGGTLGSYGGKSLHEQSHGESFISLFKNKFTKEGFYLLDEPEAALSPQKQLAFLVLLNELLKQPNTQLIIATHSPILLAFPGAQILSFDEGYIKEISYQESSPYKIVSGFISDPPRYFHQLFKE